MTEINNKELRNLMINVYPKNIPSNQIQGLSNPSEDDLNISKNKSRIELRSENYTHPVIIKSKRESDIDLRKWIISLLFAIVSVFVFSEIFLSFLDDICIIKDVSVFDINGKPKFILISFIFIFLLIFTRITLIFI
jgi:hypothetical protein